MKNTFKLIGIIAVVAAIGLMFSCGGGGGGKLSGTYKADTGNMIYTFSGNKITFEYAGVKMEGTFETNGDQITTTWEGLSGSQTDKYSIKGKKLTWTSKGMEVTYNKQ